MDIGILSENDNERVQIKECQNIPDAVQKMKERFHEEGYVISDNFTLLYPIYMDAMNTDLEGTMHQIAWLVKDEADANKWEFDRTGGLSGKTSYDFYK